MTIAGLWRYGDWRHVATGCNALVLSDISLAVQYSLAVQFHRPAMSRGGPGAVLSCSGLLHCPVDFSRTFL